MLGLDYRRVYQTPIAIGPRTGLNGLITLASVNGFEPEKACQAC